MINQSIKNIISDTHGHSKQKQAWKNDNTNKLNYSGNRKMGLAPTINHNRQLLTINIEVLNKDLTQLIELGVHVVKDSQLLSHIQIHICKTDSFLRLWSPSWNGLASNGNQLQMCTQSLNGGFIKISAVVKILLKADVGWWRLGRTASVLPCRFSQHLGRQMVLLLSLAAITQIIIPVNHKIYPLKGGLKG